jgi:hypothetical protein
MSEIDFVEQSADANGTQASGAAKKYIAELVGTFVLVLVGCGTAVFSGLYAGVVGISFAFGLTFLALVYAIGGISGCHINPAVSLSMLALGRMKAKDAAFYIVAQCIGAIAAAATLYTIAIGSTQYSLTAAGLGENTYGDLSPAKFSMTSAFIAGYPRLNQQESAKRLCRSVHWAKSSLYSSNRDTNNRYFSESRQKLRPSLDSWHFC